MISKIRKERGLTQDQFAARLSMKGLENFDQMVVAKIEGQHRSLFDFELVVIAEVLDTPIAELTPSPRKLRPDLSNLQEGRR